MQHLPNGGSGASFVLDLTVAGHRTVSLIEGGMLGKIGINSYGLCVSLMLLRSSADAAPGVRGLPIHLLLRRVLAECRSVAEAVALLRASPVMASSCFALLDASGGPCTLVELSPAGVAVLPRGPPFAAHTNHFCDAALARLEIGEPNAIAESKRRLATALQLLESSRDGAVAPSALRGLLAFHGDGQQASLCKHVGAQPHRTLATVIFDPRNRRVFIACDNPCADSMPLTEIVLS